MHILITGATGFIGSTLLPQLIVRHPEAEILCIVRNAVKLNDKFTKHPSIKYCNGLDQNEIIKFAPEYVIHLAACNTPTESYENIDPLISSNITFGLKLLEILTKITNLKLFINTGSFSQYTKEGDAYLYSASKTAFEIFIRFYAIHHNLKYITAVPYSVYGGKTTVKRIFDYIAESVGATEAVKMTPGLQKLDFIHINDVVDFYISAIENAQIFNAGDVIHLGSGKVTSLREVVDIFEKETSQHCNIEWGGRKYRESDIMYACAPPQPNIKSIWSPKISLSAGIRMFMQP